METSLLLTYKQCKQTPSVADVPWQFVYIILINKTCTLTANRTSAKIKHLEMMPTDVL